MGWKSGLAVAGALTVGLAACGSDDEPTAADDAAVSTDEMSEDEMSEDEMSDEMSEDEMSEDEMSDDEMSDDEMSDEDSMMDDGEPTRFTVTIENLTAEGSNIRRSGVFNTPDGADGPGPALPGDAYVATVWGAPGERLSFATMFVQSNDWIISTHAEGLALYDADGNPISGDITAELGVYDAGTEIDQEPGTGADQAPRQAGPDTGADDPDATVRPAGRDAANYVSVSLTPNGDGSFELRIENTSAGASTPTPLAPGVWAAHGEGDALFSAGAPEPGYGLEALAEDGDPSGLAEWLDSVAVIPTPIAPGVSVLLPDGEVLFIADAPDSGDGLEALAEDGDPAALATAVGGEPFAVPDGADGPAPAFPGESYSFEIAATPGHNLGFATMFVQSNDWFFAPSADGIALFDDDGNPISGDVTDQVYLWDAGTEADQPAGIGADQAPRQAGPDTGAADEDTAVRILGGASGIRVTVTPAS